MNDIEIESFGEKIRIERVLATIKGTESSPSVIVIAGIHGNETAGVFAVKKVLQKIQKEKIAFRGNCYFISGNLNALKKNIRFEKADLNRLWTQEHIAKINAPTNGFSADENEQIAIYELIKDIFKTDKGPFYFIDLHTTSSATGPFITISDSLNNRKFSSYFSIPIVLGIEEYLDGPLLTYINEFGHVALGFEGGQHTEQQSIDHCEACVWLSLASSGCIYANQVELKYYKKVLSPNGKKRKFYEIDFKYDIKEGEDFNMKPGFQNFQPIVKNETLAISNGKEVKAAMSGMIFMPLYQNQGTDGFFIITEISYFWLQLSAMVRKLKMHHLLRLLPGIKQDPTNSYTLIVNPKTAKFLATEIFHLFGYRKQVIKDNKLHFIKRDRKISHFH